MKRPHEPFGRARNRHGARAKRELRKLVARIPKDYRPSELGWGAAVDKEAW